MKYLIKELIESGVLKTPEIIEAFQKIDRKDFVPEEYRAEAYANHALPIGYNQTISQPLTVAFMLELLQPQAGDRILEIGSGSGWVTSLLAKIVGPSGKIYALERIPELEKFGRQNTAKYGFIGKKIAEFHAFNAVNGFPEHAPYDKIISAASAAKTPEAWKQQLKIGGTIVTPIRDSVHKIKKISEEEFKDEEHHGFVFVPFIQDS